MVDTRFRSRRSQAAPVTSLPGEDAGAMIAVTVDSEAREEVNWATMEAMAAGTRFREAGARVEVSRAAPGPLEAEMEVVEAVAVR